MKYLLNIFIYVKSLWPYYTGIILLGFVMTALNLVSPFIMKEVTDTIVEATNTGSTDITPVIWLAILFLAADVAGTFVQNWSGYLGDLMSTKLQQILSNRYYEHLLSLPQKYYDNELTGKIINRLNRTIAEVTRFINMFANNFFSMYLTLIVSIVILLIYSWQLALLMTVLYPIFMWLTTKTSSKWQAWQRDKNLQTDIAHGRFAEVISQVRVVKSFTKEDHEYNFFTRRNRRIVNITKKQSAYWHKMDIGRRLVLNFIFFGAMAYVFVYTIQGAFTLGDLVLLTTLLNQMRFPIFNMSFIVDNLQKAIAGSRDYFEVMSIKPAVQDKPDAKDIEVTQGAVEYKNVSFGYGKKKILHDISFQIKPGEKVAFVGESGEGKTTLTNLLPRLYDIKDGDILIDGQSVKDFTQHSLRKNIGVVFQEPALFSGTIRENIAYSHPKASEEDVIKAAKTANAYEFIEKLEKGLDTEIGERGLKLSGGQKQRIAIARAVLKDAPILILDEATSSLDSRSEKQVQEALDRLMAKRTTLIIAHRLSTIAEVDKIVTIKNGRIDEIGSPRELAKSGGIYNQLLDLQLDSNKHAKKKLAKFEITT